MLLSAGFPLICLTCSQCLLKKSLKIYSFSNPFGLSERFFMPWSLSCAEDCPFQEKEHTVYL